MLAGPAVPGGAVIRTRVLLTGVRFVAGTPSKVTAVTPLRFVPLTSMLLPPAVGPPDGARAVRVGAAT
jgi:hypothetical protein